MLAAPAITSPSDLAKSLDAELRAFRGFIEILQTEQDALVRGDVDRLIEFAQLKSEKVVLLSRLAEHRNHFISAQGLDPENGGMETWLHHFRAGETPQVAEIWAQLLELARTAQHLNQINGAMIETRLRNNQQALAVIQAAANQSSLYGPDGQTRTTGLGRPLGKV